MRAHENFSFDLFTIFDEIYRQSCAINKYTCEEA